MNALMGEFNCLTTRYIRISLFYTAMWQISNFTVSFRYFRMMVYIYTNLQYGHITTNSGDKTVTLVLGRQLHSMMPFQSDCRPKTSYNQICLYRSKSATLAGDTIHCLLYYDYFRSDYCSSKLTCMFKWNSYPAGIWLIAVKTHNSTSGLQLRSNQVWRQPTSWLPNNSSPIREQPLWGAKSSVTSEQSTRIWRGLGNCTWPVHWMCQPPCLITSVTTLSTPLPEH